MFLGRQRFSRVGPSVRMGQVLIIVLDKLDDLVLQVRSGRKVATANQLADQCTEPVFDLIQPGRVRGGEVKNDSLVR